MWCGDFNLARLLSGVIIGTWIVPCHRLSFRLTFTVTVYLPFLHLSFVLIACTHLSSHAATPILLSITAWSGYVKIWQVILLCSLTACFELSPCIANGTPPCLSLCPPCILANRTASISLICVSVKESLRAKDCLWSIGFKVLWHLLGGKCSSEPLDHHSYFFFLPEMNFIISSPSSSEAIVPLTANSSVQGRAKGPLAWWLLSFVLKTWYSAQVLSGLWTSCLEVCRCAAAQWYLILHCSWRVSEPHGAASFTVCCTVVITHKPENWTIE